MAASKDLLVTDCTAFEWLCVGRGVLVARSGHGVVAGMKTVGGGVGAGVLEKILT